MILEEGPAALCCGYTKGQIVLCGLITALEDPLEGTQVPPIFGPKWVRHPIILLDLDPTPPEIKEE